MGSSAKFHGRSIFVGRRASHFHFQSFTDIGGQHSEFAPYLHQFFGVRSDLKAHVFHMHFEGNVLGIPAGTKVYRTLGINDPNGSGLGTYADFGGVSEVQTGMNYLLLMGGDYGHWTLSAGYYYPVTALRVSGTYREILASKKSYAFRVMWTAHSWRWRVIAVPVMDFSSASPSDTDLSFDETYRAADGSSYLGPTSFSYKARFLRAGVDVDWSKMLQTSIDFIYQHGEYRDTVSTSASDYYAGSTPPVFGSDTFDFDQYGVVAAVRQDFGDYIGVRLYGVWHDILTNYNMGATKGANTWTPLIFGGALEFVF